MHLTCVVVRTFRDGDLFGVGYANVFCSKNAPAINPPSSVPELSFDDDFWEPNDDANQRAAHWMLSPQKRVALKPQGKVVQPVCVAPVAPVKPASVLDLKRKRQRHRSD